MRRPAWPTDPRTGPIAYGYPAVAGCGDIDGFDANVVDAGAGP